MSVDAALFHRDLVPAGLLRLASDERLVESVRAGSERAFEALFDRHRQPVLAFCRHMLGSAADAEDAMQHTFLAAYRDLTSSEKPIALRPWLYAIARYRCLSLLRARRERPSSELPDRGVDNLAAEVDAREDVRTTFTDLARLPHDQRAALILAELEDVPHAEIARILGCRRDKVKALVFQARTSLAADRAARDTPCADIRAQLATVGGALRHTNLRRHVRECPGCRAFRRELRATRRGFGILLPATGIKRALVSAVSGTGGVGAGGAALTAGALGGGGLAATVLVVVAVAAGGGPPESSADAGAGRPTNAGADRQPAERAGLQSAARHETTAVFLARGGLPAGMLDMAVAGTIEGAGPGEFAGRLTPADVAPAAEHSGADGPENAGGEPLRGAPGATEPGSGEGADGGTPATPPAQPRGRGPSKPANSPTWQRGRGPATPEDPKPRQVKQPATPRSEPTGNGNSHATPREEPKQTGNAGGRANLAKPEASGGLAKPDEPGGRAKSPEPAQPPMDSGQAAQDKPSAGPSPSAVGASQEHAGSPESSGLPASSSGGSNGHDGGGGGQVLV